MEEQSINRRVGDYELLDLLGDGAQGRVYKAMCVADTGRGVSKGDIVALKVLDPGSHEEDVFPAQAQRLKTLAHRNIVRYRDSFSWQEEWDETSCLVMEYLNGESLAGMIAGAEDGLPWDRVWSVFAQCIEGLAYAHERQVAHRDIKPANIFVTSDGMAKLIDFDIAWRRGGDGSGGSEGWRASFDYMAPDFILTPGFRGDAVSDIFSLTAAFYEALTGELPFPEIAGNTFAGYVARWRQAGVEIRPSFSHGIFKVLAPACREFILRGLERDRGARFGSFDEMKNAFSLISNRTISGRKDEYELVEYLGKGGFGEVFKARRTRDGAPVAVKHLYSEQQPERFMREARILQKASHPHIVKYVDFVVMDDMSGQQRNFLVMEYLDGMPGWSLRNRIRNSPGGLDAVEVLRLFAGYMDALQHLHDRKIIHRDIKPANLYAPEGAPDNGRIFDMGIARDIGGTVTTGQIPGTLDYMAPEFALGRGDRGSAKSDIYSTGLSLYEALTGKPAYPKLGAAGGNALAEFMNRAKGLSDCMVDYGCEPFASNPDLASVLRKSLETDPRRRYRSASEMKRAIDRVLAGMERGGCEPGGHATRRTPKTMMRNLSRRIAGAISPKDGEPAPGNKQPSCGWTPDADTVAGEPVSLDNNADIKSEDMSLSAEGGPGPAPKKYRPVRVLCWAAAALAITAFAIMALRQMSLMRAMSMLDISDAEKMPRPSRAYVLEIQEHIGRIGRGGFADAGYSAKWMRSRDDLLKLAAEVPGLFSNKFAGAAALNDKAAAVALADEWEAMADLAEVMGINADGHAAVLQAMRSQVERFDVNSRITALENEIPAVLASDNIAVVERIASKYADMLDQADMNKDTQSLARLGKIGGRLAKIAAEHDGRLREAALMWYGGGKKANGDARLRELETMGEQAPILTSLVSERHAATLAEVRKAAAGQ